MKKNKLPIVPVIGRPNVGKSTLFNRMVKTQIAIVNDEPGVTRDRHYRDVDWNRNTFTLVDTGGLLPSSSDKMESFIQEQVENALSEATLVLFVVDALTGPTDLDIKIAKILRKHCEVLVVANKAEGMQAQATAWDFYNLGFGEPCIVSALHGNGVGDMMDVLIDKLGENAGTGFRGVPELRIAVLGRPNAGKSTLVNRFAGENRVIVDDVAGTTRDSIDLDIKHEGRHFRLIDTAGLRKKARVNEDIEFYSNLRAQQSIERCDVAILVFDAERGIGEQDYKIMNEIFDAEKGLIIVINKWDLINKDEKTFQKLVEDLDINAPSFIKVPKLAISAKTGQRAVKILDLALKIHENLNRRIDEEDLNDYLEEVTARHEHPIITNHKIAFKKIIQLYAPLPVFEIIVNFPALVRDSYTKYLKNQLMARWDFTGCPVKMKLRKPKKREDS